MTFTSRPVIYIQVVFVEGVRYVLALLALFQHHLLQRLSFLQWLAAALFSRLHWPHFVDLFWILYRLLLDLCVCPLGKGTPSWSQQVLKSGGVCPLRVLPAWLCGPLSLSPFCTNVRVTFTMSTKQLPRVFMGVALNQQIKSERADSLKMLSLPTHEQRISVHLFRILSSLFNLLVYYI